MISIGVTTLIAAGIVYAATITTLTTQTINSGDNIWPGWYQAVNDKVNSLKQNSCYWANSNTSWWWYDSTMTSTCNIWYYVAWIKYEIKNAWMADTQAETYYKSYCCKP